MSWMCELRRLRDVGVGWGGCLGRVWDFFYNVFQLPNRTPPPPLCELAGSAGWGFEYMLYYWAWQGTNVLHIRQLYVMHYIQNKRIFKH